MSEKDERLKDVLKTLAAEFVQRESNGISLITITDVAIADRGGRATIYFTVLPEDKVKGVLDFLKRKRAEFRDYVTEKSRIGRIPFFDFALDIGEKNRQRIDEISGTIAAN
ncbi:MAG: ribosome-binding factor A [Candidatus Taylorbacteria bacterium]|nr:ribosome-binding factor A [Candidatus Taylorbacteria bacterium]